MKQNNCQLTIEAFQKICSQFWTFPPIKPAGNILSSSMTRLFPLFAIFNSIALSATAPTPDGGSAVEETCDLVDEDSRNLNLQLQDQFRVTLSLNTKLECSGVPDAERILDGIFHGRFRHALGHYFNTTVGLPVGAVVEEYIAHMQSAPRLFDSEKTLLELLKEVGEKEKDPLLVSCAMKNGTYALENSEEGEKTAQDEEEEEEEDQEEEQGQEQEQETEEKALLTEAQSDQASKGKIDGPVKGVFCYFYR